MIDVLGRRLRRLVGGGGLHSPRIRMLSHANVVSSALHSPPRLPKLPPRPHLWRARITVAKLPSPSRLMMSKSATVRLSLHVRHKRLGKLALQEEQVTDARPGNTQHAIS